MRVRQIQISPPIGFVPLLTGFGAVIRCGVWVCVQFALRLVAEHNNQRQRSLLRRKALKCAAQIPRQVIQFSIIIRQSGAYVAGYGDQHCADEGIEYGMLKWRVWHFHDEILLEKIVIRPSGAVQPLTPDKAIVLKRWLDRREKTPGYLWKIHRKKILKKNPTAIRKGLCKIGGRINLPSGEL